MNEPTWQETMEICFGGGKAPEPSFYGEIKPHEMLSIEPMDHYFSKEDEEHVLHVLSEIHEEKKRKEKRKNEDDREPSFVRLLVWQVGEELKDFSGAMGVIGTGLVVCAILAICGVLFIAVMPGAERPCEAFLNYAVKDLPARCYAELIEMEPR